MAVRDARAGRRSLHLAARGRRAVRRRRTGRRGRTAPYVVQLLAPPPRAGARARTRCRRPSTPHLAAHGDRQRRRRARRPPAAGHGAGAGRQRHHQPADVRVARLGPALRGGQRRRPRAAARPGRASMRGWTSPAATGSARPSKRWPQRDGDAQVRVALRGGRERAAGRRARARPRRARRLPPDRPRPAPARVRRRLPAAAGRAAGQRVAPAHADRRPTSARIAVADARRAGARRPATARRTGGGGRAAAARGAGARSCRSASWRWRWSTALVTALVRARAAAAAGLRRRRAGAAPARW